MPNLYVSGMERLCGKVKLQGAKNSALPILAASLIVKGTTVLHNCPDLTDVRAALKILTSLGCRCRFDKNTVTVDSRNTSGETISENLMREMRSSIMFLGAILARNGCATVTAPGGCELGPRPIDLHLKALEEIGYTIEENEGYITCKKGYLKEKIEISLNFPSVGATENIILASCVSKSRIIVHNVAKEPEISDLADFINKAGGRVYGAGTDCIEIFGVSELSSVEHTVIPDRIVAATFMSASAATGGDICICGIIPQHLTAIISAYKELGSDVTISNNELRIVSKSRPYRIDTIRSSVYPGFPTDAGPLLISSLVKAEGTSVFVETIFDNRFNYSDELKRMGADIKVFGKLAVIEGKRKLSAAKLKCTDLRGGAAAVVAALSAEGDSVITDIHHIERGYENIETILKSLNAKIIKE